jgi:acetylornithine deacetylase/succinyl-diaminopimelate desuccinylase-like protein
MPIRSALSQAARPLTSFSLAEQAQVRVALDWFAKNVKWINEQQTALTEIPAPSFQEEKRSAAVKALFVAEGLPVQTDKLGNVIAELRGANEKECILIAAHLDTVFPAETDVKVQREGERLLAPGISDNGTGLAAIVAIARAIQAAKLRPQRTILFAANVGEEGEGNLRGMRALIDAYRTKLRAVIVLDGSGTDHVTTKALASRRLEVTITGPGGHSWSDFGMDNARDRSKGKLEWKVDLIGSRPGGELAADSALLASLRTADDYLGNLSRIERSSTDANIPLSLGIEAIAIGAGGTGGGAHSLQEWYEPAGREMGLQRALLTLLGVSGVAQEKGR